VASFHRGATSTALVLAIGMIVACGSTSASSTSAGDAAPPPVDGFLALKVTSQSGEPYCGASHTTDWFDAGTARAGMPTTMQSGAQIGDATLTIQCSVHQRTAAPVGYDVSVSFNVQDASGAMNAFVSLDAFAAQGTGPITSAGGVAVTALIVDGSNTDQASGCTLTFTYLGQRITSSSPIGPGHLWGHLSCTMPKTACDAEADLRVENCTQ
jgi:hypothetical protein